VAVERPASSPLTGWERYTTAVLETTRARLLSGLDRVAEHIDAGTQGKIGPKGEAPAIQSGHLTLILLTGVDAELARRETP
jgi:hypothetical protein